MNICNGCHSCSLGFHPLENLHPGECGPSKCHLVRIFSVLRMTGLLVARTIVMFYTVPQDTFGLLLKEILHLFLACVIAKHWKKKTWLVLAHLVPLCWCLCNSNAHFPGIAQQLCDPASLRRHYQAQCL